MDLHSDGKHTDDGITDAHSGAASVDFAAHVDEGKRRGKVARLAQIIGIVRAYGLPSHMTPASLRLALEALGPTFVKVGQILSMRSEILPEEYCAELSKLRADVDPMPYETVLEALKNEYSQPLEEIFSFIDPTPLGSASLAQVHRATLVTGESVAIKVQRPGVRETMAQDISLVRSIAGAATKVASESTQVVDFMGVVNELWETFQSETDFLVEARNLRDFKNFVAGYAYMDCPKPYMSLCTQHIVVMDYMDGIPISHVEELKSHGYDLEEIGIKLVDNYAAQVLDEGFFHADPHPGNILVREGQIVLLDLGMTGRLTSGMRHILKQMIFAVARKDSMDLKNGLLRLANIPDPSVINHPKLLAELDSIIENYGSAELSELDIADFVMAIVSLASRHGLKMPGTITTIARSLVTLEGLIDQFMPQASMVEIISAHVASSRTPSQYIKQTGTDFARLSTQAVRGALGALSDTHALTQMLTRGQLKANVEMVGSEEPLRQISYMIDRLTMALIVVGLYIGSSVVYYANMKPVVFGIPIVGFLGYVVAFVLSVWIVIDIFLKNRKLEKSKKSR
ncbi:ABC1 kinase family protein [Alloscardovia venturai]|uniref:ABC1 kinase family protein n=1 Tax=Alloscardovia venturai TaxID=1769421 RepID=A0ABW2Y4F0_9BIFI